MTDVLIRRKNWTYKESPELCEHRGKTTKRQSSGSKGRGLRGKQFCEHFDCGAPASTTVKKNFCV
jgi:hypothetical protein